ncbi:MAG: DUF3667 domain-containing protein [Saprospiraceae bacterium]|nr:DUF3667 domain-containing protein [Saprospiraceae bacterium]
MATCKNCAHEFEGKFCPQCGQKAKTKRITTKQVFKEARERLFHYDQGFFYTMKEMLVRPGHSVREYLEGKRVRHFKPLKFLFWSAAINFLIFHYIGLDKELMQKLSDQQQGSHPIGQRLSQKVFQVLSDHPALMLFCMIPFIAFWSWLLFRRRGYNYAEHFVLNTFLMGELTMASVVTLPISKFLSSVSTTAWPMTLFSLMLWVVYFGWAYSQLLQHRKIGVWLKGGLSILLGYIFLIMVITIFVVIVIIFFRPQMEAWLAS